MADFKTLSVWYKVAMFLTHLSLLCYLFSYCDHGAVGSGGYGGIATEFLLDLGLVCILLAVLLSESMALLDQARENRPAHICFAIFALVGGVVVLVGTVLWITDGKRKTDAEILMPHDDTKWIASDTYATEQAVISGLLTLVGGIFGLLEVFSSR